MKTLFERVFNGSDQMFAKAEEEVNKIVAEVGRDAPLTMPSTAYCLACIYAYIGKKVTTVGELQDTLADVKAMMLREPRTNSIFQSGVGTAIAAEMIEACKYVKTDAPYEGTNYHGHFVDAEVRELGVPLVTGDIPGFVVIIDRPLHRRSSRDHQGLSVPRYLRLPDRRHHRAGCRAGSFHGLPPSVSFPSAKRSGPSVTSSPWLSAPPDLWNVRARRL